MGARLQETFARAPRWKLKPVLLEYMHIRGLNCPRSTWPKSSDQKSATFLQPAHTRLLSAFWGSMEVLLTGCYLHGMKLLHLWSHDGYWMGEGRGVVNMGAAGNTTLFHFFWKSLILTLLMGEELNYRWFKRWIYRWFLIIGSSKDALKKKQVPLNSTILLCVFTLLPKHIPYY